METAQWKNFWGEDRLIFVSDISCLLPEAARTFLRSHGLPQVMIFEGPSPFEISFKPLGQDLVPYNQKIRWGDFYNQELDQAWSQQLVIGEEEFCNGSAAFCVHRSNGTVTRIDVEITEPECFVNSSVSLFGESLLRVVQWYLANRQTDADGWEASLFEFGDAIRKLDPSVSQHCESFWPMLVGMIQEVEPGSYEITSDPTRSKPRF